VYKLKIGRVKRGDVSFEELLSAIKIGIIGLLGRRYPKFALLLASYLLR